MSKRESRDMSQETSDEKPYKLQTTNYKLTIVHLYPREMNIYGDTGNRLVLQKRAEWRGIEVAVKLIGVGELIPSEADIIIGCVWQYAGQGQIKDDLQEKAAQRKEIP